MSEQNIVYNVTVKIDKDAEEEWYAWMTKVHIPDVMLTGCFISSSFSKLLFVEEDDGVMYTVQYLCGSMKELQKYQGTHAPKLQIEHQNKYKDKFVAFRSIMEVHGKFE